MSVVVTGAGVIVDVGVTVSLLLSVSGIVKAYELVLTETNFEPYLVVQSLAVEYSTAA